MAIELTCGQCQGRLMAEVAGSIVACPHCGVHLQTPGVPDNTAAPPLGEAPPVFTPPPAPLETPKGWTAPVSVAAAEPVAAVEAPVVVEPAATEPASLARQVASAEAASSTESAPAAVEAVANEAPAPPPVEPMFSTEFAAHPPTFEPLNATVQIQLAELESHGASNDVPTGDGQAPREFEVTQQLNRDELAAPPGSATMAIPAPVAAAGETASLPPAEDITRTVDIPESAEVSPLAFVEARPPEGPIKAVDAVAATAPAVKLGPSGATPSAPAPTKPATAGVSSTLFMLVVSYASAMTLACGYLLYQARISQTFNDQLESLPDYIREDGKKKTSLITVPAGTPMNPLHTLKLGEAQRYGSLKVTPLKVTRDFAELVWFDANDRARHVQSPKGPVLKLHLKIENVSQNQTVVPLDFDLVYSRKQDPKNLDLYRSSNFVAPLASKADISTHVLPYDLYDGGDWDLKDQKLGAELKPGESLETYIATMEEGLDKLAGDLIWRVHFRKGLNPSQRGVTTLIEVAFNDREIVDLTVPPAPPTEPAPQAVPAKPATT